MPPNNSGMAAGGRGAPEVAGVSQRAVGEGMGREPGIAVQLPAGGSPSGSAVGVSVARCSDSFGLWGSGQYG
jgi:hypothetical protein